jgi:hypothetical protein
MFFYEVGYTSYEEAPMYTLMSSKEYTQEEFDTLVADCMIEVYYIKSAEWKKRLEEEGYVKPVIDEDDDEEEYDHYSKVDNLLTDTIEALVSKHGFSEPDFKCRFQPFGWGSIKNVEDWKGQTDSQLDFIRERFRINKRDNDIDNISK